MDLDMASLVALGIVTAINAAGWIYTKVYTYSKLEEKVSHLEGTVNDGLVSQMADINCRLSRLEGKIDILADLEKGVTKDE